MNPLERLESLTERFAQSALNAAGPQAERIAALWWLFFWVCTIIFVLVVVALLFALYRGRARSAAESSAPAIALDWSREAGIHRRIFGLIVITAVILFAFLLATEMTARSLASLTSSGGVTIELTGYRWWWRARYLDSVPERIVVTANEIHIPVGKPVLINLYSRDVIHSLWVPELHGKRDLIPGHPNALWIKADRPGRYDGQCAEFCGMQHAHMRLIVVADPPDRFDAWLDAQRATAQAPADDAAKRGMDVFLKGSCAMCHSIQGTDANGQVAPDLTHIASRATLAAGTLPNTPGHLAGWIIDPQHVKPGAAMPPNSLSAEDLQALLAYLKGLR
jgi:cytochrome c oxidase subunit II